MKKVLIIAIVAVLVATGSGMVLVKTDISNTGAQMWYQSTATIYGVGTSTYEALVTPIPPGSSAWSHLEQEAELEVDIEGWKWWWPEKYNEIEQDTELQYSGSGAIASVNTTTTEYGFGTVTQTITNVGQGHIDTFQFVKQEKPSCYWCP